MKNKFLTVFIYSFLLLILYVIYHNWFLTKDIIGGDWPHFYQEQINNFTMLPPAWSSVHGNGLGGKIISYPLDSYLYFTGWFFSQSLHIPWEIVYKFFWFGLFLLLSVLSSISLISYVFPKSPLWQKLIGCLLYTSNTYILLVVGGGQMGIALAYALVPFVLVSFFKLVYTIAPTSQKEKHPSIINALVHSIRFGVLLSCLVLFDVRVVYILFIVCMLFLVVNIKQTILSNIQTFMRLFVYLVLIPSVITVLFHAFWLLPLFIFKSNPVDQLDTTYTALSSVKFFSFASFENAISVLHPYWPENIFGKVGFMKSEYLLIPVLVFGSLLFLNNKMTVIQKRFLLFFALLGLTGAFLAKGVNEPFGQLYVWMYENIPGFFMFRDPTKFYILTIFSYCILLPFSIYSVYLWLSSKKPFGFQYSHLLFVLAMVGYLLFLIKPALTGELKTTFQKKEIPMEYLLLKEVLHNDQEFYRTLWVPQQQRFTFVSNNHPSIEARPLFHATDSASLLKHLQSRNAESYLSNLSVRYIIVPYDSLGEILLTDRKYDKKVFDKYVLGLEQISWLERDRRFKQLAVFRTRQQKDYVRLISNGKVTTTRDISESHTLAIETPQSNVLAFSQNYHPNWQLQLENTTVKPKKTKDGLQQYDIPAGTYSAELVFIEQQWYKTGAWISLWSVLLILLTFFMLQYKNFFVYLRETF